jgi:AcrR family transcriptional regulator
MVPHMGRRPATATPVTAKKAAAAAFVKGGAERPKRVRRAPAAARQHILEAAEAVMGTRGPDAVGLKDVAQAAGVSHALVCHYFGSYEALVTEVVRAHLAKFRAALLERLAAPNALQPDEWLGALIDQFAKQAQAKVVLWATVSGRLEAADAFPRTDQGLRQLADAVSARLAAAGGVVPARATIESVLVTVVAAVWGYMLGRNVLWTAAGRDVSDALDAAVRGHLVTFVTRALGVPAGVQRA